MKNPTRREKLEYYSNALAYGMAKLGQVRLTILVISGDLDDLFKGYNTFLNHCCNDKDMLEQELTDEQYRRFREL